MIVTAICTVLILAAIGFTTDLVLKRTDHFDSRIGAIADRQREQFLALEADVAYLVSVEKQRMENVEVVNRATESLEAEVAETMALANDRLAFRVRSFEERKAAFEQSFLVGNPENAEPKGAEAV